MNVMLILCRRAKSWLHIRNFGLKMDSDNDVVAVDSSNSKLKDTKMTYRVSSNRTAASNRTAPPIEQQANKVNKKIERCSSIRRNTAGGMAIVITELVLMLVSLVLTVFGVQSWYFVLFDFATIAFCLVTMYGLVKYKSMMVFLGVMYHAVVAILSTIGLVIFIIVVGVKGGLTKNHEDEYVRNMIIMGLLLIGGMAFYAWWTFVLYKARNFISDKVVNDLLNGPQDGPIVAGGGNQIPDNQSSSRNDGPPAYDDIVTEKPKET